MPEGELPGAELRLALRSANANPHALLVQLAAAAQADLVALYIRAPTGELTLRASTPALAPEQSAGLHAWLAVHGQFQHPLHSPGDPQTPFPNGNALLVPLALPSQWLGILLLARQERASFTPAEQLLAELAADREAAAIHQIRQSEHTSSATQLLEGLIDHIPSSLLVIDARLRVVAVNRNFLAKARRSARNTLGHHVQDVFPSALARYMRLQEKIAEVLRTGQTFPGEQLTFRAPGLPSRIYFYQLIPLGATARVERVLLLLDDITERERLGEEVRRAERYLASVVECAGDLVASLDRAGRIVTWNRAAAAISGQSAESVQGLAMRDLCAPEQQAALDQVIQLLAEGAPSAEAEAALLVEGAHVPIAWRGAPMHDDNGNVVALVVVGRDLTERRQLELQLIQSAKSASLGVMAGGIAHEIRNPLGIITAAAQLLAEEPCASDLHHECANRIERAAQRAATIIEDLLTFARTDQSLAHPLAINDILDETLALVSHQPSMRQIQLIRELRPDLPLVLGKPGLLQQVFTNLLLNACQAMPHGGLLQINTRLTANRGIAISIRDTGVGIDPAVLPRIFDPFFTTMPTGKGTGLGLAICASIVAQHHGLIEVESTPNHGSMFTVILPTVVNEG